MIINQRKGEVGDVSAIMQMVKDLISVGGEKMYIFMKMLSLTTMIMKNKSEWPVTNIILLVHKKSNLSII